jgi:hypothetical protein
MVAASIGILVPFTNWDRLGHHQERRSALATVVEQREAWHDGPPPVRAGEDP